MKPFPHKFLAGCDREVSMHGDFVLDLNGCGGGAWWIWEGDLETNLGRQGWKRSPDGKGRNIIACSIPLDIQAEVGRIFYYTENRNQKSPWLSWGRRRDTGFLSFRELQMACMHSRDITLCFPFIFLYEVSIRASKV